jgi:hypothetical protein
MYTSQNGVLVVLFFKQLSNYEPESKYINYAIRLVV